jgi:hypothetical protein
MGLMMDDLQKNHSIGKKGESETWPFLEKHGYIRPSNNQRKQIKEFYKKKGIIIENRGFDVISLSEVSLIEKKAITLFEVKTTGRKRGEFVGKDFIGLGFTLSEKEKSNAEKLKNKYKFTGLYHHVY